MGAVNTNNVSLAYVEEVSLGAPASNAAAEYLEPNTIDTYGASITTVARNPISKDRQNRKGTITDLSSSVSVEGDLTASYLLAFAEGAWMSTFHKKPAFFVGQIAASAADGGFTLTTPLAAALPAGTLLYSRGWVNGTNNGLKVVQTGGDDDLIVVNGGAVDEVAGAAVSVYVVGYQFAQDDVSVDADGNLVSTAGDFTVLNAEIGSAIWIGGLGASVSFDTVADTGLARVREITTSKLTIDKRAADFVADAGTGKTIQIFSGWFLRNVATDDPDFKERSYAFEATYPNIMEDPVGDGYEYSVGNLINTLELSMPLSDKAGMTITTFGMDIEPITGTRKAWTFKNPLFTEAYSTPNDFLRLRLQKEDETGLSTFFKEATITINNNASGENVLGKLGPAFVNMGNFDVSIQASAVFTNPTVTAMIRNNCTATCDICLFNNDAGLYIDIPAMTLGDGTKDFAVNEKVKIALTSNAYGDPELGYTVSLTFFPYLPTEKSAVC